jgi:hypothetical protein
MFTRILVTGLLLGTAPQSAVRTPQSDTPV